MNLLVWSHTYSIGNDIVDSQHKKLIELLNKLYDVQSSGGDDTQVTSILNDLVAYTIYHFQAEENLFQQHNYPDFAHHKGVHDKLVKDVQDYIGLFKAQDQAAKEKLMIFLTDWLKEHILGDDKKFGSFLRAQAENQEDDI